MTYNCPSGDIPALLQSCKNRISYNFPKSVKWQDGRTFISKKNPNNVLIITFRNYLDLSKLTKLTSGNPWRISV
jgi:hypothetical protein